MKTKTGIIIALSVVLGATIIGIILAQPCGIFGHKLVHTDAQAATCTEDGWNAYDTCEKCDYCTKEIIEATDHKWNGGAVKSNPTYDECGEMEYTCTACGEKKTESIPRKERPKVKKQCPSCNGNGKCLVKWYEYGDWGEVSYTSYDCTKCDGKGYVYEYVYD